MLRHCNYLDSQVTLGFTLDAVHSMGFKKRVMTHMHYYNIIHSIFTTLKFLSASPSHLPTTTLQGTSNLFIAP